MVRIAFIVRHGLVSVAISVKWFASAKSRGAVGGNCGRASRAERGIGIIVRVGRCSYSKLPRTHSDDCAIPCSNDRSSPILAA